MSTRRCNTHHYCDCTREHVERLEGQIAAWRPIIALEIEWQERGNPKFSTEILERLGSMVRALAPELRP